ncbi:MAG: hypothetical protein AWU57_571 [Marinobacter sp. T13-3]|nr:MAG: hypothetical protein AWU57_571 [Marinobacter sp. T13-3]
MRQIDFHDLHICTTPDPRPGARSVPVIVVLAESTGISESGVVGKRRTALAYLGPLEEFHQQYVPHMARLFGNQEALLNRRPMREADFHRYLNQRIEQARPLTPFILSRNGLLAYAWEGIDAEALGITDDGSPIHDDGTGIDLLYAYPLASQGDVHRMVHESLTLKEQARDQGRLKTLWIGRPIPASRNDLNHEAA